MRFDWSRIDRNIAIHERLMPLHQICKMDINWCFVWTHLFFLLYKSETVNIRSQKGVRSLWNLIKWHLIIYYTTNNDQDKEIKINLMIMPKNILTNWLKFIIIPEPFHFLHPPYLNNPSSKGSWLKGSYPKEEDKSICLFLFVFLVLF